jgi:hypothetical protein
MIFVGDGASGDRDVYSIQKSNSAEDKQTKDKNPAHVSLPGRRWLTRAVSVI